MSWLYGNGANTARTQPVISLLGPARHPEAGTNWATSMGGDEKGADDAAAAPLPAPLAHRAAAADRYVRRHVPVLRRGRAGHRERCGLLAVHGRGRPGTRPGGATVRAGTSPGPHPAAATPASGRNGPGTQWRIAQSADRLGNSPGHHDGGIAAAGVGHRGPGA